MIYPDSAGNGGGDAPEHVYTVKFTNEELWGAEAARAQRRRLLRRLGALHRPREQGAAMSAHEHAIRTQEEIAARVKALESIMIEKGIMTTEAVDRLAEIYENEVGPQLGAAVVAKAWTDPEFKARLLANATDGVRRAGHRRPAGRGHGRRREHRHRAQRDRLHAVLLLPVAGARAAAELVQGPGRTARGSCASRARCCARTSASTCRTRSRSGCGTPASEMRYWVLPQRPGRHRGPDEKALAALVTRDSMIGIGAPKAP